jgi:TorA maturation chaperone TorD
MAVNGNNAAAGRPGPAAGAERMAETARQRSQLYGFLAALYRHEPTADFLHQLRQPAFSKALSDAGCHLESDVFDRPEDELAEELAVEFTGLFIGPGKHVSPHESVHRDTGGGQLWSEATGEVMSFINRCGFAFSPEYLGLPDHISVEMEFMEALVAREAGAWGQNDPGKATQFLKLEKDFIDNHLGRWIPRFCRQVMALADQSFYGKIADLTAAFVESENKDMARLVEEHDAG